MSVPTLGQDSLRISWITCGQGEEAYALYGHTALRVQNYTEGHDLVYNYGMFDFQAPHFIWRFALGETDYYLDAQLFEQFIATYAMMGRWVDEQELLLSTEEKKKIAQELKRLASQPDWTYRYNFLKDNCTTRAWQTIVRNVSREVIFPSIPTRHTFRDILHECTIASPWHRLGNDLVLGATTDTLIGREAEFFSPLYAEQWIKKGCLIDLKNGIQQPLAKSPTRLLYSTITHNNEGIEPIFIILGAMLFLLGILCVEFVLHQSFWWLDTSLLLLQGFAGSIVAFLFFFSEHPSVNSNWNLLWLNPLPILALPLFFLPQFRKNNKGLYFYLSYCGFYLIFCIIKVIGLQSISNDILLLASLPLCRLLSLSLQNTMSKRKKNLSLY